MYTRNYDIWRLMPNDLRTLPTSYKLKAVDGVVINGTSKQYPSIPFSSLAYMTTETLTYEGDWGILFGNGTGNPTYDDYCLSNIIPMSNFTAVSKAMSIQMNNDRLRRIITYSYTNNTAETINITEVGVYALGGVNKVFLMAHEKFPSTLSVGAGETFSVSIALE